MKTGLTKKQKVTEVYFNERDEFAEVYTHNTELKKRLNAYAAKHPDLCYQTEDDGQGGLRFEIDKHRLSLHLTPPYSANVKKKVGQCLKKTRPPALEKNQATWPKNA